MPHIQATHVLGYLGGVGFSLGYGLEHFAGSGEAAVALGSEFFRALCRSFCAAVDLARLAGGQSSRTAKPQGRSCVVEHFDQAANAAVYL